MERMVSQVFMDTQSNVRKDWIAERRLWTAVIVNAVDESRGGTLRARREAKAA